MSTLASAFLRHGRILFFHDRLYCYLLYTQLICSWLLFTSAQHHFMIICYLLPKHPFCMIFFSCANPYQHSRRSTVNRRVRQSDISTTTSALTVWMTTGTRLHRPKIGLEPHVAGGPESGDGSSRRLPGTLNITLALTTSSHVWWDDTR